VDEKKEQKAGDSQHKTSLSATNTETKLHKTCPLEVLITFSTHSAKGTAYFEISKLL
jgi:hypothetical protein